MNQTNVLQVPHAPAGAGFVIEGVSSPDRRAWGAVLTRVAESPGWYRIRVVNHFMIGVWSHVRQGGQDIFRPRLLPPMAALTEDLDSPFYLAVLPLPRVAGDLLQDSEIVMTEIVVKEGETVKIQGGPNKGFKLSKIPAGSSAPEKKPKAQAKPKVEIKVREVVKKASKEPARRRREREKTTKAPSRLIPPSSGEPQTSA
ncbi:MAG TPA: hypothetical protein VIA62_11210 [Thermoanaerobaculia bacterium]|nr:hypothetical protein [Thermoanaerobaculia bacterium]